MRMEPQKLAFFGSNSSFFVKDGPAVYNCGAALAARWNRVFVLIPVLPVRHDIST